MRADLRAAGLAIACAMAGAGPGAAAGIVTKVRDNGPDANRVVIVILAEGYQAAEEARFASDAEATLADFFASSPWSAYAGHANVYTDFVASNESGADKPAPCWSPEVFKDTAFNARYCGGGSQRLLLVDFGAAWTEVLSVLPQADLVGVLVNDAEYGGAGGSLLTFSNHASARSELFLHEHGHTFAGLADEYSTPYPGFPPGDGEPNVDFDAVRGSIDWDPWIEASTPLPTPPGTPGVGCFEGARYLTTGIHRPVNDCKMRSLGRAFCPVCSESLVQSIYALVSPLDGAAPPAGDVVFDPCDSAATIELSVTPLLPQEPAWITATWELDGAPLPETGFSLSLPNSSVPATGGTITVELRDETPLVRRPYLVPMTDTAAWTLRPVILSDRDGDGIGDGCDCAPDDPDAWSPPEGAVTGLRVASGGLMRWDPAASSHEVARGRLSTLHATRGYSGTCMDAGPSGTLTDAEDPGLGDGWWYLARATNACGQGPWGTDGLGLPRAVGACP